MADTRIKILVLLLVLVLFQIFIVYNLFRQFDINADPGAIHFQQNKKEILNLQIEVSHLRMQVENLEIQLQSAEFKNQINVLNEAKTFRDKEKSIIVQREHVLELRKELLDQLSLHQMPEHKEALNDVPYLSDGSVQFSKYPAFSEVSVSVLDRVPKEQWFRYSSQGVYWERQDDLYRKFQYYNKTLNLPTLPEEVQSQVDHVCSMVNSTLPKLCRMFTLCYTNTLKTATRMLHDGTAYVITGDIPLMWIRDSCAQINHYIPLTPRSYHVQIIVEGVIRRHIQWIKLDPYGSSFRLVLDYSSKGKQILTPWDIQSGRTIHVAMHNYEIDSLCYFIKLSYEYWKATGIKEIFDIEWKAATKKILETWIIEQDHPNKSNYVYPELPNHGLGSRVCVTGLTWVGFRPSDDPCTYHYNIPGNMFAVASLRQIAEIAQKVYLDDSLKSSATKLADEIDGAIHRYGLMDEPAGSGKIYAYEVDGCGNQLFMDDANVPSLLSIPYIGYRSAHDPHLSIANSTRHAVLSRYNPYFFEGRFAKGIGSPHTKTGMIWHMSLIIQALTSHDMQEIQQIMKTLLSTDAGTNLMHESFDPYNPKQYTREWFGWANSLFAELTLKLLAQYPGAISNL